MSISNWWIKKFENVNLDKYLLIFDIFSEPYQFYYSKKKKKIDSKAYIDKGYDQKMIYDTAI